jgi:hypothetical protein
MVYLFYNFIRYKLFLFATFQTALLHCMMYGNTLVGAVYLLSRTRVTVERCFSSASFHFSVGANLTILCYLPIMCLNQVQFPIQAVFYVCSTWSSFLSGNFFSSNVFYQCFSPFLTNSMWDKVESFTVSQISPIYFSIWVSRPNISMSES